MKVEDICCSPAIAAITQTEYFKRIVEDSLGLQDYRTTEFSDIAHLRQIIDNGVGNSVSQVSLILSSISSPTYFYDKKFLNRRSTHPPISRYFRAEQLMGSVSDVLETCCLVSEIPWTSSHVILLSVQCLCLPRQPGRPLNSEERSWRCYIPRSRPLHIVKFYISVILLPHKTRPTPT